MRIGSMALMMMWTNQGTCVCMQELEPKAALQQIALPMNADKRAAGIATLSQLVWTADKSRMGMPRADFMRSVREQLTAAEQVRPWALLYSDYGHKHCTLAVCYIRVSIRYLRRYEIAFSWSLLHRCEAGHSFAEHDKAALASMKPRISPLRQVCANKICGMHCRFNCMKGPGKASQCPVRISMILPWHIWLRAIAAEGPSMSALPTSCWQLSRSRVT